MIQTPPQLRRGLIFPITNAETWQELRTWQVKKKRQQAL